MKKSILLAIFAFALPNLSSAVTLFAYRTQGSGARVLLPANETESPLMAWKNFLRSLSSDPDLKEFIPKGRFEFEGLIPAQSINGKVLILANDSPDLDHKSRRFHNLTKKLSQVDTYLLPVGALNRFSQTVRDETYSLITERFDGLIALGGDDIDPSLYQQEVTYSRRISPKRDALEIEFLKNWMKSEKGFLLGICRGHQISAVALGASLYQDVQAELPYSQSHQSIQEQDHQTHWIQFRQTKNKLLKSIFPYQQAVQVNSLHHQAVVALPNSNFEIAAVSSDGVVEAIELSNGKGLLLQFHPELLNDTVGNKIMTFVQEQVQSNRKSKNCSSLF